MGQRPTARLPHLGTSDRRTGPVLRPRPSASRSTFSARARPRRRRSTGSRSITPTRRASSSTWSALSCRAIPARFFELPGGPIGLRARRRVPQGEQQLHSLGLSTGGPARRQCAGQGRPKQLRREGGLRRDQPADPLRMSRRAKHCQSAARMRLSDYSAIGSTTTWNVIGVYAPIPDMSFRGTYSVAVRAPNIQRAVRRRRRHVRVHHPTRAGPRYRDEEHRWYREATAMALSRAARHRYLRTCRCPISCSTRIPRLQLPRAARRPTQLPGSNADARRGSRQDLDRGRRSAAALRAGLTLSADWYDIRLHNAMQYSTSLDIVDLCFDRPRSTTSIATTPRSIRPRAFISAYH